MDPSDFLIASTMTPRSLRSCISASDFGRIRWTLTPDLFDTDVQSHVLGGEIDELKNVRLQHHLRHSIAGHS